MIYGKALAFFIILFISLSNNCYSQIPKKTLLIDDRDLIDDGDEPIPTRLFPPTAPSVSNQCGKSVLTRGNPPAGVTWYWQSSSSGTSTSSSSVSITRTSGSVYYIRARSISTGAWSLPRTVSYSIKSKPSTPSTPSVSNQCGKSVLTRGTPPSGVTWYWQSSSTGTSTSNSATSLTRTSGNRYYLRARNNSTLCWSSARSISYAIKSKPSTPSTPLVSNQCGKSVLNRSSPPSGVTWYWQSSSSGTSTSNSATSLTRTSGTRYYLRARNNSTLCWSSARSVSYAIKSKPSTPSTPSVSNQCGKSVLTRGTPPSGVTWYWQSSSTGTSTSNSATSLTRTSGNRYYLRARNNSTLCWSSARSVSYAIKSKPSTPSTPSVSVQCGKVVLSRGTPPSGVTWYWQSSSSGTSTGNSAASINRTSGSTYYLRARNNSTLCWSSSRSVGYTLPVAMPTPILSGTTKNCGSTKITIKPILTPKTLTEKSLIEDESITPEPLVGSYTLYWQTSSTGTSTSTSGLTSTRTSGTKVYARWRNSSNCWGPALTINYTVNTAPTTPATPTVSNQCGKSVLTRGTPPSGVTWYWQSSSSGTSTSNSSTILNRTSGTKYYLRARNNTTLCWSSIRTVNYAVKSVPSTPSAPLVSNQCGKSVLTRSTPPSGVTWYWQSSSSGTSTSSSATTLTRTSGSKYYLRARNNSTSCWSSARSVSYAIISKPSTPATPLVSNQCGKSVLTRGAPPSGVTWYWQSSSSGTSTSNSAASINRTSGSTYYLRAKHNITSCWSSARSVSYAIKSKPSTPSTPSVSVQCGKVVLTRVTPPSGVTWYWQSSSSGTSTSSSATSINRTSGSSYYLRARNNTTLCWSSSRSVSYTLPAAIPTPVLSGTTNNCGSTLITIRPSLTLINNSPVEEDLIIPENPSEVYTLYWQTSSTGTSTSTSGLTSTRTSGTKVYARWRNSSNCWGPALTVNYTVNTAPTTPATPTVSNQCGKSVLTRGTPPSGITWYWQSSSSGKSTSNSSTTLNRTSGTKYYLRARNNTTLCWSSARSMSYAIKSVPATPPVPTTLVVCEGNTLTRANPPSNHTYYWQSSTSGTSTSSSAKSITRTSGSKYYLRSKNTVTGCWSSASTVTYTLPAGIPSPVISSIINNCGSTTLSAAIRILPEEELIKEDDIIPLPTVAGFTLYWQSSASGTSLSESGLSTTRTSGTKVYARWRNSSN
ncbi:MAG: hypothetical protein ABJE13_17875, partial [Reichenbachiella sp.]